jgi:tetratricopeptide (TPR) repeat protein
MEQLRKWLSLGLLTGSSLLLAPSLAHAQSACESNIHFERAESLGTDYATRKDPRVEKEYRLAFISSNRKCTDALLELSGYLNRSLRFGEAAVVLKDYIKLTPREDHAIDAKDLANLQKASVIKSHVDNGEAVQLADILELTTLVHGYAGSSEALPYAERARELYPESTEAILVLVRELPSDQTGRMTELLDQAVALEPANVEIRNARGWHFMIPLHRFIEAEAEFRMAVELSKNQNAGAWYGLGSALMFQGQKQRAVEALRNFQRLCKNTPSCSEADAEKLIEQLEGNS